MVNRLLVLFLGAVLPAALFAPGCAPVSSERADSSGSSGAIARVASDSSLEALRRGEKAGEGPLKNIYFDFDRYDLRTDAREALKSDADWLKANPQTKLDIEGHCDQRGTTEYNLALGAKRAQAARDYLVTLGISTQRLSTVSYGKELPVCKEGNEECWQRNRRDRFNVTPAGPAL